MNRHPTAINSWKKFTSITWSCFNSIKNTFLQQVDQYNFVKQLICISWMTCYHLKYYLIVTETEIIGLHKLYLSLIFLAVGIFDIVSQVLSFSFPTNIFQRTCWFHIRHAQIISKHFRNIDNNYVASRPEPIIFIDNGIP